MKRGCVVKKLPEGYGIFFNEDHLELYAPDGEVIGGYYDPGTKAEQIAEQAMRHKAAHTVCEWDPGCPTCEARRRVWRGRAWVA